ncbi:MAG: 50S ribosomal protein L18e [Euryarchaeota archaeon]|nr:50S ribosomal protein L18e [Euryarchaeota archaeon]MEC7704699.1 50S ribosomal protein L18e [Candidatus Thermoplasmatota archaeon]MED5486654.1 50S ribosomal protein L18e [Candidatus Thermoplasmatota archaeon]|tara:strand:- start:1210 stop:1572 length:363 start_codon:yes stop_codon:yes gene_type:complete
MEKNTKTNPGLVTLISDLKAQTRSNGAPLWRDVALRLEKSRSNWAEPNLSRLSRYASDEKEILVPGKLLGSGEVTGKHTVAAFSVSTSAREKIEAAGGKVVSIHEMMKKNPTGKGVYILG